MNALALSVGGGGSNLEAMGDEHITPAMIRAMKGTAIPALTAYDYAMTRVLDDAGIPLILVGDSLGMVVLGYPDTTHVTLDEMEHHVRAVARAKPSGLIVADMPYRTYENVADALGTAKRLLNAGAGAVKAEGGREILDQIRAIVAEGFPFMGHLGMLPQHVKEEGGYRVKGKVESEHLALLEDAKALESAGAFSVVLELVTPPVAREITRAISIPTIGIGAGNGCDGQILVTTDLWGTSPDYIPRHVKMRPDLGGQMRAVIKDWVKSIANDHE